MEICRNVIFVFFPSLFETEKIQTRRECFGFQGKFCKILPTKDDVPESEGKGSIPVLFHVANPYMQFQFFGLIQ